MHYLTDLLLVKIELLVKILCIFWFIVNKDEYISQSIEHVENYFAVTSFYAARMVCGAQFM